MAWLLTTALPVHLDLAAYEQRIAQALSRSQKPDAAVSLRFISHEESKRLNTQYRQKENVGNVLSFPAADIAPGESTLGDVLIAYPILRDGFPDDMTDEDIATALAVHGLLHLLGYDHEEDEDAAAMEAEEQRLLA